MAGHNLCLILTALGLCAALAAEKSAERAATDVIVPPQAAQPAATIETETARRLREESERRELVGAIYDLRRRFPLHYGNNTKWHSDAMDRESALVEKADRAFDKKDFERARRTYREALDIAFDQWVFDKSAASADRAGQPVRRRFCLATNKTFWCLQRLDEIATVVLENDLESRRQGAVTAQAQENYAESYARWWELEQKAEELGRPALVEEGRAQRQAIVDHLTQSLDAAERAFRANEAGAAVDALDRFRRDFEPFKDIENRLDREARTKAAVKALADVKWRKDSGGASARAAADSLPGRLAFRAEAGQPINALRARYEQLAKQPLIMRERTVREAARQYDRAMAALRRGDYASAQRTFKTTAGQFPDTPAGAAARKELAAIENDPVLSETARAQEAELPCKALLLRAQMMLDNRRPVEALEACETLLKDYGDTPWARDAVMLKAQIEMRFGDVSAMQRSARPTLRPSKTDAP